MTNNTDGNENISLLLAVEAGGNKNKIEHLVSTRRKDFDFVTYLVYFIFSCLFIIIQNMYFKNVKKTMCIIIYIYIYYKKIYLSNLYILYIRYSILYISLNMLIDSHVNTLFFYLEFLKKQEGIYLCKKKE